MSVGQNWMNASFAATWTWGIKKAGNLAGERVEVKYVMSIDRTTTPDAADGALRPRNWRLSDDVKWRNATLTPKMDPVLSLVVEVSGRRLKVPQKNGRNVQDHRTTKGIIPER